MQEKRKIYKNQPCLPADMPLAKHMRFFGGNRPEGISFTSVTCQNHAMGDNWLTAAKNAAILMGVAGYEVKSCPFHMFKAEEAVGVLNHPNSSGIFNQDGSINEEKWQILLQYAEKNESDEDIITQNNLQEFLTRCRSEEKRPDTYGFGLSASKAEWDTFFTKFGIPHGEGQRCVTIHFLRDFYEDSQRVGHDLTTAIPNRM